MSSYEITEKTSKVMNKLFKKGRKALVRALSIAHT